MGGTRGFTGKKRYLATFVIIGIKQSALCRPFIYIFFLTLHFLRNTSAETDNLSGRYNPRDYT
jgi:hypothetical protein